MLLSIIVPVFNMAADGNLEYCLNSLLAQTVKDYEIIAVDDASTDRSAEILKEYEQKYPDRFHALYLKQNRKQGGAKNAALEICQGEYIGFVDSDDWVMPDMYERLIALAKENDAQIASCDLGYVYEHTMKMGKRIPGMDPKNTGELDPEKRKGLILESGALVTKVYRRELFFEPKLRFPEHMFYEDNAVGTELFMRAGKVAYLPEAMYFYYQRNVSTVHTVSEEKCRNRMEAMRIMLRKAREGGYFDAYRTQLEYKFTRLFYLSTLFSYMQGSQKKRIGFISELGKEMKRTFPDFQENLLYKDCTDPEERKMVSVQQKSTKTFFLYYQLLWSVRSWKRGKRGTCVPEPKG